MKIIKASALGLMVISAIAYFFLVLMEAFVKIAGVDGNIKFVIYLIMSGAFSFVLFGGLRKQYSLQSSGKANDMELAISALREIQVKASELPDASQHDAHVIGALAVTVEEILTKEKDGRNA